MLANTPRPGPFDLGEMMRCFAATLMSVSVLVTGATTAFPEEPCWRNPEECSITCSTLPTLRRKSPPPQQYQYPQPDWMKDADKLKPLGNPRNYERPFGERFKDKAAYERPYWIYSQRSTLNIPPMAKP